MNHRQRLLTALNHQEPDRVPFDLGSTQVTGIHIVALQALRQELGLPTQEAQVCDAIQGLALPGDDLVQCLGVDVRGLYPRNSHNWKIIEQDDGAYWRYHDEWGITHRKPKDGGLYYSLFQTPLASSNLSAKRSTSLRQRSTSLRQDIEYHPWPDFSDPERIAGLRQQAEAYHQAGYAVVLKDPFAGIFEMSQRIVGMENLLIMMASDQALAGVLFEKMAALKLAFWEMALPRLADVLDVISQADDYGTQASQIISPRMFRQQIKPHWKTVLQRIRELAPNSKIFFHSCGNVRPLIPDFIEIGVEVLNPVHIRATGMQPAALKRDFGDALSFWGGGVDTQDTLPHGNPEQVKDEVRRNIEALATGGGFVFNAVHNIQADVPPGNMVAMWEALQEYGVYV